MSAFPKGWKIPGKRYLFKAFWNARFCFRTCNQRVLGWRLICPNLRGRWIYVCNSSCNRSTDYQCVVLLVRSNLERMWVAAPSPAWLKLARSNRTYMHGMLFGSLNRPTVRKKSRNSSCGNLEPEISQIALSKVTTKRTQVKSEWQVDARPPSNQDRTSGRGWISGLQAGRDFKAWILKIYP